MRYRHSAISLVVLLSLLLPYSCKKEQEDADIYEMVDREMELAPLYEREKEKRIDLLRHQLSGGRAPDLDIAIYDRLIEEYETYQSDSALHYIDLNLRNPKVKTNKNKTDRLMLKQADILSHAGLFRIAEKQLDQLRSSGLDETLLPQYYKTRAFLYQYLMEYFSESAYGTDNERLRDAYTDSLLMVAAPGSSDYIVAWALSSDRNNGNEAVTDTLLKKIEEYESGEHEYSLLTSVLSYMYKRKEDEKNQVKYLALSAISDFKGVVRENGAIRELATICYENSDIERANRYVKHSFSDANSYASRMRNAQSSKMLPIIDEAYTTSHLSMNRRLTFYGIAVSVLAAILMALTWVSIRQMRRARRAKETIATSLEEQEVLSERLREVNLQLEKANTRLQASSILREEYAGLFMEYCSLAISGLQQYHQSLRVMATTGNIKGLLKKIDSTDIVNKTLHDFYDKFDEAILNLYPDFVEKFNTLLRPDEQLSLRSGERLNTELRIFALIRIGITDSEKIAHFLRCSLSTVYTYRSRVKSRAITPETFELDLSNIV